MVGLNALSQRKSSVLLILLFYTSYQTWWMSKCVYYVGLTPKSLAFHLPQFELKMHLMKFASVVIGWRAHVSMIGIWLVTCGLSECGVTLPPSALLTAADTALGIQRSCPGSLVRLAIPKIEAAKPFRCTLSPARCTGNFMHPFRAFRRHSARPLFRSRL